jgi:hypothetical protein
MTAMASPRHEFPLPAQPLEKRQERDDADLVLRSEVEGRYFLTVKSMLPTVRSHAM